MPEDTLVSDHFAIPETQKAWRVVRKGLPSKALHLNEKTPVKTDLAKGEVLVKVEAAALNPVGYKMMGIVPAFVAKFPQTAEYDFSGVVVNGNGTEFKNGQEVFGSIFGDAKSKSHEGALAQFVAVPAANIVERPANISPTGAAGLAMVGLTAHQAIFDIGKLEPGMSIFINGGSTAVGASAIQFARAIGCKITVAASGQHEDFVKSLGADVFIDYTKEPVHRALEQNPPEPKFHLILEAVGNIDLPLYTHSEKYLAPGGIFVSVMPQPDGLFDTPHLFRYYFEALLRPTWLGGTNRKWKAVMVKVDKEDLKTIATMVEEGKFRPVVDSVFSFEDTLKAYDRIMTKHTAGKVVVKVEPDVE
ncbi:hypothetical protein C8Q75DRAFT_739747 [Abortiporus biennis]|nr:hypothetical protein C8Q75DRAFT_739747 [Abortiporus biennis]